jgi:hypothetical protein
MSSAPRVHFALPAFGGAVTAQCMRSILDLGDALRARGIPWTLDMVVHESLVQRARNHLVADFLRDTQATHLLFIDADIQFRPGDVLGMLDAGKPVVCGAYPAKGFDLPALAAAARDGHPAPLTQGTRMVVNVLQPESGERTRDFVADRGCVPILEAATGFLLLERRVVESVIAAHPEILYESDTPAERGRPMWAVFDCAIVRHGPHDIARRYLSEDYLFSRRVRALGFEISLYLPAQLGHVGQHVYRGDVFRTFRRTGEPATEQCDIPALADGDPQKAWHIDRYRWAAARVRGTRIANAACGTNYGARILRAARPEREVVGYDRHHPSLALAQAYGSPVSHTEDLCEERLERHDSVVSLETIEHLERPWDWIRDLVPRELVISVPCLPTMHANPFHLADFTPADIREGLARNGWRILEEAFQAEAVPDAVMLVHAERAPPAPVPRDAERAA